MLSINQLMSALLQLLFHDSIGRTQIHVAWTMMQFYVLKVEMRKEMYPIGTIEKYVNK